jgi:hypothetical protein
MLPSTPASSMLLFPSVLPTKTAYAFLLSLIRARGPAHLILRDLTTQIKFCADYRLWSPSLCNFLQSPVKKITQLYTRVPYTIPMKTHSKTHNCPWDPERRPTHNKLPMIMYVLNKLFEIRKQTYAVYR